jgi:hypothetical protein
LAIDLTTNVEGFISIKWDSEMIFRIIRDSISEVDSRKPNFEGKLILNKTILIKLALDVVKLAPAAVKNKQMGR